jgi:hypothetical protein
MPAGTHRGIQPTTTSKAGDLLTLTKKGASLQEILEFAKLQPKQVEGMLL